MPIEQLNEAYLKSLKDDSGRFGEIGRWIKTAPKTYFVATQADGVKHKDIASAVGLEDRPLDAGSYTALGEIIFWGGFSTGFNIESTNPERPKTLKEIEEIAQKVGIEVRVG